MPIHVQRPDGKVLTWAEKEHLKLRNEFSEWYCMPGEIIRIGEQRKFECGFNFDEDPYAENERGEE